MAQQISRVAFVAIPYAGLYFWYFWDKPKVHLSFDSSGGSACLWFWITKKFPATAVRVGDDAITTG
jgi:hypothetical protein